MRRRKSSFDPFVFLMWMLLAAATVVMMVVAVLPVWQITSWVA